MFMEDARPMSSPGGSSISGRQLFWLLVTVLGTPIFATLATAVWDFVETQRIWKVIDANGGFTLLSPGSITIDDSSGLDGLVGGRPLFRYQVVKASIGFHVRGDEDADFSQPLAPGAQHPLAVLERLPNLEEVLVSASRISPEGIGFLARCRRLSRLHLSSKELTAEQLQPLAACRSLREFGLDGPSLSGAMVSQLQPLPDLERLAIQNAQIDDAGMLELSRMKSLRNLDFFYSKFEQSTLGGLADLPNLLNLSISSFDINPATFQGVGRIIRLRSLSIRSGIGDEIDRPTLDGEIAELAGLTELRELYLESGKITGAALDTLLRFTKLETLFAESEFTDDEAIRLANGLKLKEFVVYSRKFNDPQRICNEVIGPKLYFQHPGWPRPGYVMTSFEPRR
jgi:hypothetical protein